MIPVILVSLWIFLFVYLPIRDIKDTNKRVTSKRKKVLKEKQGY